MKPTYRIARHDDIGPIFEVRISVHENRLDRSKLRSLGITEESIAAALEDDLAAWVAEYGNKVVGFSMARSSDGRLFALFILPEYEKRGIGKELLKLALEWLEDQGVSRAWLTTEPQTRAARFYRRQGWCTDNRIEEGEIRFEIDL